MGLWSRVMDWLNDVSPTGSSGAETGSAVLDSPPASVGPTDAALPDAVATEPPWWRPEGPLVLQAPRFPAPAADGDASSTERGVLKSLEAALDDPNIELPHLPRIPEQVLLLVRRDDTGMREIAQLISQDQVLSAALLRRANSVAYGGATKVTALGPALARLGTRGVKSFMISESVKQFTVSVGDAKSRGQSLWRESLASGYVMAVCADCFGVSLDDPFLVGLLHDIGKVVVLRACHDAELAGRTVVSDDVFNYLCQEYHEMMGAMLAEHWRLPEGASEIIGQHHGALNGEDPHANQRALVQLTDALVSLLGYGHTVPYDVLGMAAAIHLGADGDAAFRELLETLPEVIELAMSDF